jgi:hypothetical protein
LFGFIVLYRFYPTIERALARHLTWFVIFIVPPEALAELYEVKNKARMKKLYSIALALFGLAAHAQVVNIADAKFKAKLLAASPNGNIAFDASNNAMTVDANANGQIETAEAATVYFLNVQGNDFDPTNKISDLTGISAFTNLKYLNCQTNLLTTLDVAALTNLETLICSENHIYPLEASGLSQLKNITATDNQIGSLDALHFSGSDNIEYLRLDRNLFTSVDLTGFHKLKSVDFNFNDLVSINVNGLDQLEQINITYNDLVSIDLASLPNFKYLNATGNFLAALDVSHNPLLTHLYLRYNQLTTIDLSHNHVFFYLNIQDNALESMFIKNGHNDTIELNYNPNLAYICADESELANVMLYFNDLTEVNSYCTFVPGGDYYTVAGSSLYDESNDGCDAGDIAIPNLRININNGVSNVETMANASGDYGLALPAGSYTITPSFENSAFFTINPSTLTASFPTDASPLNQNFCVSADGVHRDLEVVIIPLQLARPGFDCGYRILYKNKGNQVQSGNVAFAFNDAVLDFVSASPMYSAQFLNYLNWNFTDLHPFETRSIDVWLNLNSPIESPPVFDGFLLNFTTSISNTDSEETPMDNVFMLNQYALNSHDPNDKTCLEGNTISTELIGKYVHYMIRFENTGSASAVNVVVKDIIDMTKFDIASLVPMTSSHPFQTRISGNKVEFIFENIDLPFDDAHNDGFIVFKIKTLPNLIEGNILSNTANIYFDYNAPIDTAPAVTGIGTLAKQDFAFDRYFRIYPNPTRDFLNVEARQSASITSIDIYNALGQLVLTLPGSGKVSKIDVTQLRTGNYMLVIHTDQGVSHSKFIKK